MQSTFFFRAGTGEWIETEATLSPDPRSALFGRVVDAEKTPLAGALVMLFETGGHVDDLHLSACQYTDENGHFLFGPLESGKLFVVKVYKNAVKLRQLEIIAE